MAQRKKARIIIPQSKSTQDYLSAGDNGKSEALVSTSTRVAYRSKHLNSSVMGSLSLAIKRLKLPVSEVLAAMELFINQRIRNPEYIRIAQMLEFYQGLNPAMQKSITYEELAEKFAIDHILFIAAIAGGMYSVNLSIAKATLAGGMNEVVEAIIHRASQKNSGATDSKLALQVTGLLDESTKVNVGALVNGNITGGVGGVAGEGNNMPNVKMDIMSIDEMIRESYSRARNNEDVIDGEVI